MSGFFGGLSGQQGALRALFLARSGLDGHQFIGTSVTIAVAVDIARLSIYLPAQMQSSRILLASQGRELLLLAIAAAFIGTLIGKSQLKKITIGVIRTVVAVLLLVVGALLATGIL